MFITESIIDDYNKTDARFMYKQNTQYLTLHLQAIAHFTKNDKIYVVLQMKFRIKQVFLHGKK